MKYLGDPQSGSRSATTASRNRFGQYYRTRATPVNPKSSFQGTVRARLAASAAIWRTLTAGGREQWDTLGALMKRTDSLGQQYDLSGFQAFVSVNTELAAAGDAAITAAPALETPATILTATITATTSAISVAFTPTPLGTGERLFVFCSPPQSAGRQFCGDYRLVKVSAAALASPQAIKTEYEARFGAVVAGQRIFFALQTYKGGFLSGPLYTSQVVS